MRPTKTSILLLSSLAWTVGHVASPAAAAPASAQETSPADVLRPNVPPDFNPAARGLARTPLVSEDLGFAMHPPAGAMTIPQRSGGQLVLSIVHQGTPPKWSMSVQHLMATSSESTAAYEIESHLAALRQADRPHRMISNEQVAVGGSRGQLCFIEQAGPRGDVLVSGWLMLPIGDAHYLVFSITAMPDEFPSLRPVIETAFATLNLRTAEEVAERRLSRIDAGRAFLQSITPEQLRALVGVQRWSRIYEPNPSGVGETEIGYSLLEVREAMRGELNPNRAVESYTPLEQQPGLLVRLQGRLIGDAARNIFFDSLSVYWLSWDMEEEAWDVKATERQPRAERTQAETGLRTRPSPDEPRPLLAVIRDSSATRQQNANEWAVPDVYLSQALSSVLGRLLPMDESQPGEYAWYFYNYSHATPQITQRIDRWAPAGDGSGNWILRTQLSVDSPVIQSIYSPSRELVRTVRPDGVITEPTTPNELRRIWERKGLPMGRPTGSGGGSGGGGGGGGGRR